MTHSEQQSQLYVAMSHVQAELIAEQDRFSCPLSCSCQFTVFNELPIARWVNHMTSDNNNSDLDDSDLQIPSKIKLATCLLQEKSGTQTLLNALPIDLQALILLHTGSLDSQLTGELRDRKCLSNIPFADITHSITLCNSLNSPWQKIPFSDTYIWAP